MSNLIFVSGSLHSHGCWTDYRNQNETRKFPFDLESFVRLCIDTGRNFQAITDIMASRPGKPEFKEHRYSSLLKNPNLSTTFESKISLPSGHTFYIPRTQEVLTDVNFKHILAVGLREDIPGGLPAVDTLKKIKEKKGYVVIDHPFMCDAWAEDELLGLYKDDLIDTLEFNGGLTFPAFLDFGKFPSKKANLRVLKLEDKIPVIANDDSHSSDDIERGAYTVYTVALDHGLIVPKIFQAIKLGRFQRQEHYSLKLSPFIHVYYGRQSQKMFGDKGLPDA